MKVLLLGAVYAVVIVAVFAQVNLPENDCTTTDCKNGECVGTPPRCVCYKGFLPSQDPKVCLDVNECQFAPPGFDICGYGKCHNQAGNYSCICHDDGIAVGPTFCVYNPYAQQNSMFNLGNWIYWKMIDEAIF